MSPRSSIGALSLLGLLLAVPPAWGEIFGNFHYEVDGDEISITNFPSSVRGRVDVPASIEGKPVTTIAERAFDDCPRITFLALPDGLLRIESHAFQNCDKLHHILVPPSVVKIGAHAFEGCSDLLEFTFPPGVTEIADWLFASCVEMQTVRTPAACNRIGEFAFANCSSLSSISISKGVASIGNGAFSECRALRTLTLPTSLGHLGSQVFREAGLSKINLPPTLTKIPPRAFSGCENLTHLTIPDGVTTLGLESFARCGLKAIELSESVTTLGFNCFRGSALRKATLPNGLRVGAGAFAQCYQLETLITGTDDIAGCAFLSCYGLQRVVFTGDAPTLGWVADRNDRDVFAAATPGFTVYYLTGSSGFSSPTWEGYAAQEIHAAEEPAQFWLLSNGLPPDTDLQTDHNGDGIPLLLTYALGLDPCQPLGPILPAPELIDGKLTITISTPRQELFYCIEVSSDLETWTTSGVTLLPSEDGSSLTASIPRDLRQRFLRLVVKQAL